jgi:transcriptional regulator CBF1
MSIVMAEQMDFDHSGLQQVANAVRENASGPIEDIGGGTAQKRKRETSDQDGSADSTRRTSFKRVSPNSANTAGNGNESSGPSGNAMMDNQQDSAAVEALQEYNSGTQNGADHANASSTAAAALGIYPTMTIPQPTDVSFATHASDVDRNDSSYNMGDSSQQDDSFNLHGSTGGAQSSGGRGSGTGSKPAVGSEEWHKVRKDNHKEGMLHDVFSCGWSLLTLLS